MKLGVSTYNYGRSIREGAINYDGIVAHAKKTGFDTLDISIKDDLRPFLPVIKKELAEEGMELSCIALGADFLRRDPKKEIERVKSDLDISAEMGAKVVRHDASAGFPMDFVGPRSFDNALPLIVECCGEITQYAKTLGIRTCTENHGFFAQDSERVEKIICAVNDANFGTLLDMGNFLCADEDPLKAVARMAPYAFHVHAKDFHFKSATERMPSEGWFSTRGGNYLRGAIVGHGIVPVFACLKLIKKAGYCGTVALEFEGMESSLLGVEAGYRALDAYRKELAE